MNFNVTTRNVFPHGKNVMAKMTVVITVVMKKDVLVPGMTCSSVSKVPASTLMKGVTHGLTAMMPVTK